VTRRPSIHVEEVPEVVAGLVLRLEQHLETRVDIDAALLAFRALYRLSNQRRGNPQYPCTDFVHGIHYSREHEASFFSGKVWDCIEASIDHLRVSGNATLRGVQRV